MPIINLKDLQSEKPEIKYHCVKKAIVLSQSKPQLLYPQLDVFIKLLDGENRILKWTAIIVISNLSQVDDKNKINKLVPRLISFLKEKEMITAANSIKALGQIAKYKPALKEKILKEFLKVEKAKYYNKGRLSPECRNIAIGKVILALDSYFKDLKDQKPVIAFVKRQTKNSRPATAKKASEFLKKLTNS